MGRAFFLWLLLAAMMAGISTPAFARDHGAPCIAYGSATDRLTADNISSLIWDCDVRDVDLAPSRTYLRFDLGGGAKDSKWLVARRSAFSEIHLLAIDGRKLVERASVPLEQLQPALADSSFKVALPASASVSETLVVAIDHPTHGLTSTTAQLTEVPPREMPSHQRSAIVMAMLCGALLMPLIFNFACYRVLREPFVLWHAALSFALFLQVVIASGTFAFFVAIPANVLNALTGYTLGGAVACACVFAAAYIEPGKLDPRLRAALPYAGWWAMMVSFLHGTFPFMMRPVQTDLFYAAFLPILALLVLTSVSAIRRRSRAVMFQIVGWAPLIVVGIVRVGTQLTPGVETSDAMQLFYFGAVFDVLATAIGVADRFMIIKRERDRAQTRSGNLEKIASHDPLTGLLNRRSIDEQFDALHKSGFETFALIDLDHFKAVNDRHGHVVGDEVLKSVARTLRSENDSIAIRMGGEEFLLLMLGPATQQRAEQVRRALSTRIAHDVEGLDMIVTASMGLVEMPRDAMPNAVFADVYSRADKLLYEAKEQGRNRTVSERIQAFHHPAALRRAYG